MLFESDRVFQFWDYNTSHKQLLVRSPASALVSGNIDLVFWRVDFIGIPTLFNGIELDVASGNDVAVVERSFGKTAETSNIRCLMSEGRRFFVVAGGFKVLRNDLDIFDSSLYYFSGTDGDKDLGQVLAHS